MGVDEGYPPVFDPTLPLLCLLGPTAAGKTALALKLCEALPLEIISVDSSQVYRYMDIGTAKPDPETLVRYPHHLIDIREPSQTYSAAEFRSDALRLIPQIIRRGHVPLLVGGTMLYVHALLSGLSRLPQRDPVLRQGIIQRARKLGWPALYAELCHHDAQAASRIQPNDSQRIQRALEVVLLTGHKLSELQAMNHVPPLPNPVMRLCVIPGERAELHQRISRRFAHMLEQGFLGEVQSLLDSGQLSEAMPALKIVGYRQIWQYLQGQCSLVEAQTRAVAATRQLAKRQLTWLRHTSGVTWWLNPLADPSLVTEYVTAWLTKTKTKTKKGSEPFY